MKFFHLSDLHIGLRLYNRDLSEDQRFIFKQIADWVRQEQPEAILIAGDIYDKVIPSAEAVALFDQFVGALREAAPESELMIISGNHDSAVRLDLFRPILERQKIHMIGLPPEREGEHMAKVVLRDDYGPVCFYLLPFVKPSMVSGVIGTKAEGSSCSYDQAVRYLIQAEEIDQEIRNVLVSHQFYLPAGKDADRVERMDSELVTVGNIDAVGADILDRFDYAALGHIHKPMKVGSEFRRYCGTPLACSVSEAGQQKAIISVELGPKGEIRTDLLPLNPLRQVRVVRGSLEELLLQPSEDYVSLLLTDEQDLDVIDMQDRLRSAFPNLLEIRREAMRRADYETGVTREKVMDPYELVCAFLKEPSESDRELLRDVINTVGEVKE